MSILKSLARCVETIDKISYSVGMSVKWLLLVVTLLSAGNAIIRKFFGISSNGLLEAQWYMYSAVFLLGGAYCLQKNSHVRIDFLSNRLGAKLRNLIDVVGITFILIPFCYYIITLSWELFAKSWIMQEMSGNAGGLIRWPVYLVIPVAFGLLMLQAWAELIKRMLFLLGFWSDSIQEEDSDESLSLEEHAELVSTTCGKGD